MNSSIEPDGLDNRLIEVTIRNMKTNMHIEFSGTVAELAKVLTDSFPDQTLLVTCSLNSDGAT